VLLIMTTSMKVKRKSMLMGSSGGKDDSRGSPAVKNQLSAPDKPLLMGDIIYISVNRNDFDGYICSEGFVDNRITVQWFEEGSGHLPLNFSECLFRVVPKRSYKAQSQVRKLEKRVNRTYFLLDVVSSDVCASVVQDVRKSS
jgi:hypothetical protein